jgi:DNA-binding transcriptional LysR family regulator
MKSFSKAAEAKLLTQSAMSHLIKNLEAELGVRLFDRHGKSVVPTPAGRLFYEDAKKILAQYKAMENNIYSLARKVRGLLHIGASATVASYLLPQVFYSYCRQHPAVQIELTIDSTENIMQNIKNGDMEIGIIEGSLRDFPESLETIASDEIVVIASDNAPLSRKAKVSLQDLLSQPLIMPEAGSGTRTFIDDFFRSKKISTESLKIVMTIGDPGLIVQMVKAGLGISFVSKWSAFEAVKEGSVRLLHLSESKLKRKFYMTTLKKESATSVADSFAKFIREFRFFIPF